MDTFPSTCCVCREEIGPSRPSVLQLCACLIVQCLPCTLLRIPDNPGTYRVGLPCLACGESTPLSQFAEQEMKQAEDCENQLVARAFECAKLNLPRRSSENVDKYKPLLEKFAVGSFVDDDLLDEYRCCHDVDRVKLFIARMECLRGGVPASGSAVCEEVAEDGLPLGPLAFLRYPRNTTLERILSCEVDDWSCGLCGEDLVAGRVPLLNCQCAFWTCIACCLKTTLANPAGYLDGPRCSLCRAASPATFLSTLAAQQEERTLLTTILAKHSHYGRKYRAGSVKDLKELCLNYYSADCSSYQKLEVYKQSLEAMRLPQLTLELVRHDLKTVGMTGLYAELGPLRLIQCRPNVWVDVYIRYVLQCGQGLSGDSRSSGPSWSQTIEPATVDIGACSVRSDSCDLTYDVDEALRLFETITTYSTLDELSRSTTGSKAEVVLRHQQQVRQLTTVLSVRPPESTAIPSPELIAERVQKLLRRISCPCCLCAFDPCSAYFQQMHLRCHHDSHPHALQLIRDLQEREEQERAGNAISQGNLDSKPRLQESSSEQKQENRVADRPAAQEHDLSDDIEVTIIATVPANTTTATTSDKTVETAAISTAQGLKDSQSPPITISETSSTPRDVAVETHPPLAVPRPMEAGKAKAGEEDEMGNDDSEEDIVIVRPRAKQAPRSPQPVKEEPPTLPPPSNIPLARIPKKPSSPSRASPPPPPPLPPAIKKPSPSTALIVHAASTPSSSQWIPVVDGRVKELAPPTPQAGAFTPTRPVTAVERQTWQGKDSDSNSRGLDKASSISADVPVPSKEADVQEADSGNSSNAVEKTQRATREDLRRLLAPLQRRLSQQPSGPMGSRVVDISQSLLHFRSHTFVGIYEVILPCHPDQEDLSVPQIGDFAFRVHLSLLPADCETYRRNVGDSIAQDLEFHGQLQVFSNMFPLVVLRRALASQWGFMPMITTFRSEDGKSLQSKRSFASLRVSTNEPLCIRPYSPMRIYQAASSQVSGPEGVNIAHSRGVRVFSRKKSHRPTQLEAAREYMRHRQQILENIPQCRPKEAGEEREEETGTEPNPPAPIRKVPSIFLDGSSVPGAYSIPSHVVLHSHPSGSTETWKLSHEEQRLLQSSDEESCDSSANKKNKKKPTAARPRAPERTAPVAGSRGGKDRGGDHRDRDVDNATAKRPKYPPADSGGPRHGQAREEGRSSREDRPHWQGADRWPRSTGYGRDDEYDRYGNRGSGRKY